MRTAEEFWRLVDRDADCWLWLGGRASRGRPIVNWNGNPTMAYRVSLELVGRPVPPSEHVHHECRQPLCVRPEHLRVLSCGDHTRLHRPPQTHCKYGHPLVGPNLGIVRSGKNVGLRYCRTCNRLKARARVARNPTKRRYITPVMRVDIILLAVAGLSHSDIAQRMQISRRSVGRALDPAWKPFVPGSERPEIAEAA